MTLRLTSLLVARLVELVAFASFRIKHSLKNLRTLKPKAHFYFLSSLERIAGGAFLLRPLLWLYYLAAQASLNLFRLPLLPAPITLYARHRAWRVGTSDIDVIAVIDDKDPDFVAKRAPLHVAFYRYYGYLRRIFPMLCAGIEVRFILRSRLQGNFVQENPEMELIYSLSTWHRICGPALDWESEGTQAFAPSEVRTRFLDVNLHTVMPTHLLRGRPFSPLKFHRGLLKCYQQHYLANEQRHLSFKELETQYPAAHRRSRAIAQYYELLRFLDEAAQAKIADQKTERLSQEKAPPWIYPRLEGILWRYRHELKNAFQFVAVRPLLTYEETRVYALLTEHGDLVAFEKAVRLFRKDFDSLRKEGVFLRLSTSALLTSRWFHLWSDNALEGEYLLASEAVYTPGGSLTVALPPNHWSFWKIKEILLDLEESSLPVTIFDRTGPFSESPLYRCLLHYHSFLQSPQSYRDRLALDGIEKLMADSARALEEVVPRPRGYSNHEKVEHFSQVGNYLGELLRHPSSEGNA